MISHERQKVNPAGKSLAKYYTERDKPARENTVPLPEQRFVYISMARETKVCKIMKKTN